MEIKGKVHCFFEQSGTFKNEFIKLGIPAEDYDIQNNFGETNHVIDLFTEIENAYEGKPSIFDNISKDDLIIAFFPCIYFTGSVNPRYFTLENTNYRCMSMKEKFDQMLKRADNRNDFYKLLYKMVANVLLRDFRLIIENPFSALHYLHNNFLKEPTIVDSNRQRRGDYFRKPTGYWFFNCENTIGYSYQKPVKELKVWESKGAGQAGQGYACARINSTVRRLMPIETERLMGFPDNHTRIEWDGNSEEDCPDVSRYKSCGNSMCVNCMEWIGRRISMVESMIREEENI